MNNQLVSRQHTERTLVVGSKDIAKFHFLQTRRHIRTGMVNDILSSLEKGIHWTEPITVNERNGVLRVKNGNHRMEALKRYLAVHPESKIEVNMLVYKDLTDEEENEVYDRLQNITKESAKDFLQIHQKEIPLFQMLQKGFCYPITSYGGKTSFPFKDLVDAYLGCLRCNSPIAYNGTNIKRLEAYKQLGKQDMEYLNRFLSQFIAELGHPTPGKNGNRWAKTTPFIALMRLHYDNEATHSPAVFWRDVRNKVVSDPVILETMRGGGVIAQVQTHQKMREAMNKSKSKKLFVLAQRASTDPAEQEDEEQ